MKHNHDTSVLFKQLSHLCSVYTHVLFGSDILGVPTLLLDGHTAGLDY